jgi:hypothetical protein
MTNQEQLESLDQLVKQRWDDYLKKPETLAFVANFLSKDRRPYALYLTQVYHYTYHTARNQALVGVNPANTHIKYMKFCFEHALEETGHELMASHDLRGMGVPIETIETDMPPALPPTELLVAYLYWVSSNGNPVQRLGYSYWAERSYGLVGPLVENMAAKLGLEKKNMTFYFNHAQIDDKHAQDVEKILCLACKSDDDWLAVRKVAEITIDLTQQILQAVVEEYQRLRDGESSNFTILNAITPE